MSFTVCQITVHPSNEKHWSLTNLLPDCFAVVYIQKAAWVLVEEKKSYSKKKMEAFFGHPVYISAPGQGKSGLHKLTNYSKSCN